VLIWCGCGSWLKLPQNVFQWRAFENGDASTRFTEAGKFLNINITSCLYILLSQAEWIAGSRPVQEVDVCVRAYRSNTVLPVCGLCPPCWNVLGLENTAKWSPGFSELEKSGEKHWEKSVCLSLSFCACATFRIEWNIVPFARFRYSAYTDKVERNCHFPAPGSHCFQKGKLILLILWGDTWLVSSKPCSSWRWVMHFQPGDGMWRLRSTFITERTVLHYICIMALHRALRSETNFILLQTVVHFTVCLHTDEYSAVYLDKYLLKYIRWFIFLTIQQFLRITTFLFRYVVYLTTYNETWN
jgi:hypothetical protein